MHREIKCACCLAQLLRQGCHPVIHDFECNREFAEIIKRHSTDDDCLFTLSKLDLYHQLHELLCQLLQNRFF